MRGIKRIVAAATLILILGGGAQAFPLVKDNTKREGYEYKLFILKSDKPSVCQKLCEIDPSCSVWEFVRSGFEGEKPKCYLQRGISKPAIDRCCVSGIKPAYLFKRMEIREPWGREFKVVVCNPLNIPGSREKFGWKEEPRELGEAAPPKGAKGILYLAPPNESEPAVVEGVVRVPERGGELLIRTAGNINSSYKLVVKAGGEELFSGEIDGSRWRTVRVDLSKWRGKAVKVELLGYPLGWFYNYIFIDSIELR